MAEDLPYPPVLGEFVDILHGLQITSQEQFLLESIMHLDMATMELPIAPFNGRTSHTSSIGPRQAHRRRYCNIVQQTHHAGYASPRCVDTSSIKRRAHGKDRNRLVMMKEMQERFSRGLSRSTAISPKATQSAIMVPWQSSDLPLSDTTTGSEISATADDHEESHESSTPGSATVSGCSTPSESSGEQPEWMRDFIKVPWSDDGVE